MSAMRMFVFGMAMCLVGCDNSSPFVYRTVTIRYPGAAITITGYCAIGIGRYETGGLADVVDCLDHGRHVVYAVPHQNHAQYMAHQDHAQYMVE